MAGSIKVETKFTITFPNGPTQTFTKTATVTSLSDIEVFDTTVAASGTRILWDPTIEATERMASFDFLALNADGVLDLELTTNEADANEELAAVRLIKDIPFMLGADDSWYNHSASNAWGGTIDLIDKIRVKEPAAAARILTFVMGKKSA